MLNKLDAVKYFCTAAEKLNFRETAQCFSISPSVITRMMSELEDDLGEQLFKRNTRNIQLTSFGEQFLPQAQQWLKDGEALFQTGKEKDEMAGVVRITVPNWRANDRILDALLTALEPYPGLTIDWRNDMSKLDPIEHRIDIGLRIGLEPEQNFIVRRIADIGDILAASPRLLAKSGTPANLDDLEKRYPFIGQINANTGKMWPFILNETQILHPRSVPFVTSDNHSNLQAILHGKGVGLVSDFIARPYVQSGELVHLLPETDIQKWQLFLYRPYQSTTPARVLTVFELLHGILLTEFNAE